MEQKKQLSTGLLLTLILVVFLDTCNFFMPVPVYTPLFIHGSFLPGISASGAMIWLGVLISCFGFAQLFGGPIFGELSDYCGRKKVLIIALVTGMIGTLLAAISLSTGEVSLIYISRLIIGFSSGTIGVSYAVAADFSSGPELSKNIGIISLGPCFASAIGPLIGGHLASNPHLSIFGYATPFYFLAALFAVIIIILWAVMPTDKAKIGNGKLSIRPLTVFTSISQVIKKSPVLCRMVLMAIFFQLGTEGFFLTAPILAVKEYHLTPDGIANHFLFFAIGSGFTTWLNTKISRRYQSTHIYLVALCVMIVGFLLAYSGVPTLFWAAFLLFGLGGMLCWVHTNNMFSSSWANRARTYYGCIASHVVHWWHAQRINGRLFSVCALQGHRGVVDCS